MSEKEIPKSQDEKSGIFDAITAGTILVKTGIPIPPSIIARLRAGVGRLIDGAFEIPASKLKLISDNISLNQTIRHELGVNSAKKAGEIIGGSDEYAVQLFNAHFTEIALKQTNKEMVAKAAIEDLRLNPPAADSAPDTRLDADWLNYFSEIASQKSSAEMQQLLGKVLAGEIRKPGTFSPMTIQALSLLTQSTAQIFERLCKSIMHGIMKDHAYVNLDVHPNFLHEGIADRGISYLDIINLRSYGLLAAETGSRSTFNARSMAGVRYGSNLIVINNETDSEIPSSASLLTSTGNELSQLLAPAEDDVYLETILSAYRALGLTAQISQDGNP